MDCVWSAFQDQLLLLLDIFPSLGMSENNQKVTTASSRSCWCEEFSSELCFWDNGLKSQQGAVQLFVTETNLKGLPLTSKAASGDFGQFVWNWIKGNDPRFEKIRPDTNNRGFT